MHLGQFYFPVLVSTGSIQCQWASDSDSIGSVDPDPETRSRQAKIVPKIGKITNFMLEELSVGK